MQYYVEVMEIETGEIIKSIPCKSWSKAEKMLRGVIAHMDEEKYTAGIEAYES